MSLLETSKREKRAQKYFLEGVLVVVGVPESSIYGSCYYRVIAPDKLRKCVLIPFEGALHKHRVFGLAHPDIYV